MKSKRPSCHVPKTKHYRKPLLGHLVLSLVLVGCADAKYWVVEPPPLRPVLPAAFLAGIAERDITPPLNAPLFGYSWDAKRANGVWTRLKARVLALQDSHGERLALVQVDLGAISALVHRRVAMVTSITDGITADRLLIAATHTHAGPGGFFGEKFFNFFGAALSPSDGFDEEVADLLTTRISEAVHEAFGDLRPAAIGAASVQVPNATHNRSCEAWQQNEPRAIPSTRKMPRDPQSQCSTPGLPDVDPTLRLLRIDRVTDSKSGLTPLAAVFVFAIHGTAMPQSNRLYHGDLHAIAVRHFAGVMARENGQTPFLAMFMNGAAGDVSPCPPRRQRGSGLVTTSSIAGRREMQLTQSNTVEASPAEELPACRRLESSNGDVSDRTEAVGEDIAVEEGLSIAQQALKVHQSLNGLLERNPTLQHSYREVELPGAETQAGFLCRTAEIGAATIGGAEDGRSIFYGVAGVFEGSRAAFSGCQTSKKPALGILQQVVLRQERDAGTSLLSLLGRVNDHGTFPRIAPFQIFRLGNAMVLAAVPGEPTTELGWRIRDEIAASLSAMNPRMVQPTIAVVGLANDYLFYFTTPEEFHAQHYEGASTLYGPLQGVAASEQLGIAARFLGRPGAVVYYGVREFAPGSSTNLADHDICSSDAWRILGITHSKNGRREITARFRGPKAGENCGRFPKARIVCGGVPLKGPDEIWENDEGFRFKIRRVDSEIWEASWRVPTECNRRAHCSIEIEQNADAKLVSEEFSL